MRNYVRVHKTLEVEKLVYGGDGLARDDGRAVLIPFVLPGETVEAGPIEPSGGILRGALHQVLKPAPERAQPPCPYFGRCGGCQYQHAAYESQLLQKRSILVETLARVGKVAAPPEIPVISAEPWAYRNRVQLHLDGTNVGYLEARSRKLCAIDHCPISSPRINEAIRALAGMQRDRKWPRFVRTIELFTNENDVQINILESEKPVARHFFDWCRERIPGAVAGSLDYPAGDIFRVSGRSFFQVNRFLVNRLVEIATAGKSGGTALDLYAGVGLFSLALARKFNKVTAVESGAGAIRDLQFNTERAGVSVEAHQASAEAFLDEITETFDFVLADPPRAGLGKHATGRLLALRPPELTIVACDPATLARDLAMLIAGGYRIGRLTMVDLFPQTYHIETVVELLSEL